MPIVSSNRSMEFLIMAQSSAENFLAGDKKVIAPLYGKPDIDFVSGEGSYLTDASGKKYLDFVDGIAVNTLGHRHPAVIAAIEEQLGHFIHLSNLYPNYPRSEEHTSELQSPDHLVCRLLLEKK